MASLQPGVNKTTKFMSKGTLKNGVTQGGGGGGMAFLIFSHYRKNRPIHLWFVLYLTQVSLWCNDKKGAIYVQLYHC